MQCEVSSMTFQREILRLSRAVLCKVLLCGSIELETSEIRFHLKRFQEIHSVTSLKAIIWSDFCATRCRYVKKKLFKRVASCFRLRSCEKHFNFVLRLKEKPKEFILPGCAEEKKIGKEHKQNSKSMRIIPLGERREGHWTLIVRFFLLHIHISHSFPLSCFFRCLLAFLR